VGTQSSRHAQGNPAARRLAAAYAEAGDFDEAARWQERALADPSFTNYEDGLRRLELYRNQQPYRIE